MILNSIQKRKKRDPLQMKQIDFHNVLEKEKWCQYRIFVKVLNENIRNLKNWSEIWTRDVINFIINDENSSQFARQTNVNLEDFQESKMISMLVAILDTDEDLNDFLIRYWDYHRNKRERSFYYDQ